jgi:phage shock protein E
MKIISLALFLLLSASLASADLKHIDVVEAKSILDSNSSVVLLDIRTPGEFYSGKIDGAQNIDMYQESFISELSKLDKDGFYIIYCATGGRTRSALRIFQRLGFKRVYNMMGGITSWERNGYPVTR